MNKALFTVLAIILVLAIAGGAFYGGMVYGKSQAQASATARALSFQTGTGGLATQGGQPGQGGFTGRAQRTNGQGGGFVFGTIKEISDGGLVLTDNNGKDTQVKVTDTTLIEKNTTVKLSDLAQGETLIVSGSKAADGTVTARSVQVAPQGRFGMMGGPDGQGQPGVGAPGAGQDQPGAPAPQPTPAQ